LNINGLLVSFDPFAVTAKIGSSGSMSLLQ
jgi:hypothetical protein